jgi:hypothetical protein
MIFCLLSSCFITYWYWSVGLVFRLIHWLFCIKSCIFVFCISVGRITSVLPLSVIEIIRELSFNIYFILFIIFHSRLFLILLSSGFLLIIEVNCDGVPTIILFW